MTYPYDPIMRHLRAIAPDTGREPRCQECGSSLCEGRDDPKLCEWAGIHDCPRCHSRERGYCTCDPCINE